MTQNLTPDELEAYHAGFLDGLTTYAWHKDGKQWVGTTGSTLADAVAKATTAWNYLPDKRVVK